MIGKIIKLFRKFKPDLSEPYYLKEWHMKKYFPEFQKIDSGWELEFSCGNSLTISFNSKEEALLFLSTGSPESGYSTMLYTEKTTHDTLKYCIDRYSTDEWKKKIERQKRIENLGI